MSALPTLARISSQTARPLSHSVRSQSTSDTHIAACSADIPSPSERFIRSLAAQAFEVIEGRRNITQLGWVITVAAARRLAAQRAALRESRALHHDQRVCIPSPGRVHLCRVQPHLAKASLAMHTEHRSYAVSLSLEWMHGHWRACEIYVL